MPENPPRKEDLEKKREKPSEKSKKNASGGAWSEDQRARSYYYDDACGYEIYKPDEDEQDED